MKKIVVVLAGFLAVSGPALASDPCSDPAFTDTVTQMVICHELIKCDKFGGWAHLKEGISIQEYADAIGFQTTGPNMNQQIRTNLLKNGYRMVEHAGQLVDHVDAMPIHYDESVGRYTCRMTISWNMKVYPTILFANIYGGIISKPGAEIGVLIGPDAGWTVLKQSMDFDSRVDSTTDVDYDIVGRRVRINHIGRMWNDK